MTMLKKILTSTTLFVISAGLFPVAFVHAGVNSVTAYGGARVKWHEHYNANLSVHTVKSLDITVPRMGDHSMYVRIEGGVYGLQDLSKCSDHKNPWFGEENSIEKHGPFHQNHYDIRVFCDGAGSGGGICNVVTPSMFDTEVVGNISCHYI